MVYVGFVLIALRKVNGVATVDRRVCGWVGGLGGTQTPVNKLFARNRAREREGERERERERGALAPVSIVLLQRLCGQDL